MFAFVLGLFIFCISLSLFASLFIDDDVFLIACYLVSLVLFMVTLVFRVVCSGVCV